MVTNWGIGLQRVNMVYIIALRAFVDVIDAGGIPHINLN